MGNRQSCADTHGLVVPHNDGVQDNQHRARHLQSDQVDLGTALVNPAGSRTVPIAVVGLGRMGSQLARVLGRTPG